MINEIRNIIADVASGRIKDTKIVQLAGELEKTIVERDLARAESAKLAAHVSDLETQVKILQPPKRIEKEAEKVLNYVYDTSSVFSRKKISNGLGIAIGSANHCVNVLLVREFVKIVGRHSGAGDVMELTPSGMHYVRTHMKNG